MGAQLNRSEPTLDLLAQVVAVGVPCDGSLFEDVGPEVRNHITGIDGSSEPDSGLVALAVEVGRHDERFVGERVVAGQKGGAPGTELVLQAAPERRKAIWVCEQEHGASPVGD